MVRSAMLPRSLRGPIGLRLIAAYKLAKAAALLFAGAFVLRLDPGRAVAGATRLAARFRLDPDDRLIHAAIARLSGLQPGQLAAIGVGVILYGLIYVLEGVGLLLGRRWAESLVVATTGFLIPAEAFEVMRHGGALRATILLANIAVVVYLVRLLRREHAAPPPPPATGGKDSGTKALEMGRPAADHGPG